MTSKRLNAEVLVYKKLLANGDIQATYQALVGIVQHLRTYFKKKYKDNFSIAAVLHGYIDFTYFYLQNESLKKRKLKFAVVLNHKNANFELWLLGQTKEVQKSYWEKLKDLKWVNQMTMPEYSIFEVTLLDNPDFDNPKKLLEAIANSFDSLSSEILVALNAAK